MLWILAQPWLRRVLAGRHGEERRRAGPLLLLGVFGTGVYGGYFGAAQGILVLSILGLSLNDDLQRLNALKVVLTGLVNLVAGVVFVTARTFLQIDRIQQIVEPQNACEQLVVRIVVPVEVPGQESP